AVVDAIWLANSSVNESADFVMLWWDRAAEILKTKGTLLRRFGFVTTNSITQVFNRRVVQRHLAINTMSIVLAIPDHPWTEATKDAAAVRIAMTVVVPGDLVGVLRTVISEKELDTDQPIIQFHEVTGKINSNLTIGADITSV